MKGFFKKTITLFLALAFSATLFACSPSTTQDNPNNSNKVVINVLTTTGAYGEKTAKQRAARFETAFADKDYGNGKTGVHVNFVSTGNSGSVTIGPALIAQDYDIIGSGDYFTTLAAVAENGYVANIDSIVRATIPDENKSILDKIDESQRWTYCVNKNGSDVYYAFPGNSAYGGLTFDKELFDKNHYYIAAPDYTDEPTASSILAKMFYFADAEHKSVGPNGIAGDEDDGLPSSLFELIALCERIKDDNICPFIVADNYEWYINYFANALYVSLLGPENGQINNFNSDGLDVVVGYEDAPLFPGSDIAFKKPITQRVAVDESCGYYYSYSVEKYYTYAFFSLMKEQEWYRSTGSKSQVVVDSDFVFGIKDSSRGGAMLVECSYWYNEATDKAVFEDYKLTYPNASERQVRWMPLPINIETTVTGANETGNTSFGVAESKKGENITLCQGEGGFTCINKNCEKNAQKMEAIKDYLLFIFSDAELSKSTPVGCYGMAVNYEVKEEDYVNEDSFTKAFLNITKNAKIIYSDGDSNVFRNNRERFMLSSMSGFFATNSAYSCSIKNSIINNARGGFGCFEDKIIATKTDWNTYYGGTAEMATAKVYPAGHAKAGQDICYTKAN